MRGRLPDPARQSLASNARLLSGQTIEGEKGPAHIQGCRGVLAFVSGSLSQITLALGSKLGEPLGETAVAIADEVCITLGVGADRRIKVPAQRTGN